MDINKLLHDHQIALMNAGKPSSVGDERFHVENINQFGKLIEAARTKFGVDLYPIYTSHIRQRATGPSKLWQLTTIA